MFLLPTHILHQDGLPPMAHTQVEDLADYLASHPWDVQHKGPLLVIDPAKTLRKSDESGWAGFDRKLMSAGQISVVAPETMVMLNSQLQETPDLYDGLPMFDKIKWLMSTFTGDQWTTAGTTGIGFGDLRQDQSLIYRSILPHHFSWTQTDLHNSDLQTPPKGVTYKLSEEEESAVRLKFVRNIALQLSLAGGGGLVGMPVHSNSHILNVRSDADDPNADTLFGVKIRAIVPNRQKPTDLAYKSTKLDASISLAELKTAGNLVQEVSTSSGIKIVCDPVVAPLPIYLAGTSGRAGDLLAALALATCGTYRRVGTSYVFTSDLIGLGTATMRVWSWGEMINQSNQPRRDSWNRKLASDGLYRRLATLLDDEPSLSPEILSDLEEPDSERKSINVGQLSPEWQKLVNAPLPPYLAKQPIDRTNVHLSSTILCRFVLPNGIALSEEGEFGYQMFAPPDEETEPPAPPVVRVAIPPVDTCALVLTLSQDADAERAVRIAAQFGFKELWIATLTKASISQAVDIGHQMGISVRLFAEPWRIPANSQSNCDFAQTKETYAQALIRMKRFYFWQHNNDAVGFGPDWNTDLLSPFDPDVSNRWHQIQVLSETPGLTGTVIYGTQPPGYGPMSSEPIEPEGQTVTETGFSESAREAFLKSNGRDPFDLVDPRFQVSKLNLKIPYFSLMQSRRRRSSIEDGSPLNPWFSFKSKRNEAKTTELLAGISGDILIAPRTLGWQDVQLALDSVVPWKLGEPLPTKEQHGFFAHPLVTDGSFFLLRLGNVINPKAQSTAATMLSKRLTSNNAPLAADFTSLPPSDWARAITKWFSPKAGPTKN